MTKTEYSVLVGNIGTVHRGYNKQKAIKIYNSYVTDSKCNFGRGSHENVVLMMNHEPSNNHDFNYGQWKLDSIDLKIELLNNKITKLSDEKNELIKELKTSAEW